MKKIYEWAIVFFFSFVLCALLFIRFIVVVTSDKAKENSELYESEQYYKTEYERILNENSELKEKVKEEKAKYNEVVNSSSYKRALYAEELEKIIFESEKKINKQKEDLKILEDLQLSTVKKIRLSNDEYIMVNIPKLPLQVSYLSSGNIVTTVQINKIKCNGEENYDGTIDFSLYFSGYVVYSSNEKGEPEHCRCDYVLYDSDNNPLDRDPVLLDWHIEGDSFVDLECNIYDVKYDDEYTIKLYNAE